MDYSIIQADISDKGLLRKINQLLGETFGHEMPDDKLENCTRTNSPEPSLYLAASLGDELIGFNAFISHDLLLDGSVLNCYQSCWTATSDAHRGKKIFQNLINAAKEDLSSRGAAFIFGFPNANSQPIFTKKLGFKEIPSLKWQVPNIPIIRDRYINVLDDDTVDRQHHAIIQNDRQLIDLKTKQHRDELLVIEHDQSLIWGTPRKTQKIGLQLRYFEIGGIYVANSEDLKPLFDRFFKAVRNCHYVQLTTSSCNSFNAYLRNLKPAQTNDLIVFDLNFHTGPDIRFNFFGGVKDVF